MGLGLVGLISGFTEICIKIVVFIFFLWKSMNYGFKWKEFSIAWMRGELTVGVGRLCPVDTVLQVSHTAIMQLCYYDFGMIFLRLPPHTEKMINLCK